MKKSKLTLEEQLGRTPTIEDYKREIERLECQPTIYEVLMMPLKGLPLKECKHYLQATLDDLDNNSTVN